MERDTQRTKEQEHQASGTAPQQQPKRRTKEERKGIASALQSELGMNRSEARRAMYGDTYAQATSHPSRRTRLAQQVGVNARRKRARLTELALEAVEAADAKAAETAPA